jgi:hypothetical protein
VYLVAGYEDVVGAGGGHVQRLCGVPLDRNVGEVVTRLLFPLPVPAYFPYRLLGMLAHHHLLEAHPSFLVGQ